jgi:hypothetical protein
MGEISHCPLVGVELVADQPITRLAMENQHAQILCHAWDRVEQWCNRVGVRS